MRPAILALVLLPAATACNGVPVETRVPPAAALLDDAGGRIDLVALVVASPQRASLRNQELVERVIRGMGPHTRFLVLADPEMFLDPNPLPGRLSFATIPEGRKFTIWPQDPFVVLRGADGGAKLLAARDYGRSDDREVVDVIAGATGWPVEESSLFFAGGNIVSDERRAFVGADLIRDNVSDLGISPEAVRERFAAELGKEIHVVGASPQAVAHIDVALTPLGQGRCAVADSRGGAAVVAATLQRRPETVREFERDAERNFFGNPGLERVVDVEGRSLRAPPLAGTTAGAIEDSRAVAPALDEIAGDLERLGYTVVRVPMLLTRPGRPEQLVSPRGAAGYPLLSYNNVLVERIDGHDVVYLPEYGLEPLDAAARDAWTAAGFEVRTIAGATTSAMYRGSLRCTAKVLSRAD